MHAQPTLKSASIAIYARFSSELQSETSVDDQVRRCREYLAQAGADLGSVSVFSDFAVSGASLQRPGFEALMGAVEDRRVDAIVTEDISRISRDFADAASAFKRLQYAGVPLIGIADGIDTGRRDAKLSFTRKSLVADIYIDDLRDETLRGLEGRANAGFATGNVAYGYRTVADEASARRRGNRIEVDEDQAALVRRIFAMYRDGKSLSAIARALNAEGISALHDLEAQARDERSAIARLQTRARAPVQLPGLDDIAATAVAMDRQLRAADPETGRERLRRLFLDGRIQLIPKNRAYRARSRLRPLVLFVHALPKRKQRDFFNEIALFDDCSGGPDRMINYLILLMFSAASWL